jgi:tetratricopeptide (TPR) repeat protein
MSAESARPQFRAALWIFLLAFTVRLIVLIRFSGSLHFLPDGDDMKFYSDWALRIADGKWTDGQAFYGLPGYAYALAFLFLLVGGFDPFIIGTLQALMDAGVAVLIWKISHLVFAPRESETRTAIHLRRPAFIGLGAALAWIFFQPVQAFSAVMMPTIWLVCAYYFCVWFALKTETASWWQPWLWLGLLVGSVAMLVATILFTVPLFLVAIFRSVGRGLSWTARAPRIAGAIAILVGGIYVGASPAWLHNHLVAHEPVMLSAHSGINFWIGNNPTSTGYPKMPPGIRSTQEGLLRDSITLAEEAVGRKMTRAEVSKYWSQQANAYISTHFSAWLRLMGVKLGNFWNAYQYDDLSIIKLLRDEGILLPGLKFGFVAALGLAGLVPVLLRFPRAGWVVAAVLLHMGALLPVFVTERYRLAAVPGLIILGAGGLWLLWESLALSRWSCVAKYLATAAAAAWFVSIPRADIGLWSLDHYKAGIRATTAGQLELLRDNPAGAVQAFDRAQHNLETAYAYVPDNADIDFALGNLWLARSGQHPDPATQAGQRAQAKLYYRLALDLNPRHTGTLNNLGVLAMEEKRWPLAEKFFLGALASEPGEIKTRYLLARVYLESGRLDDARAELAKALAVRPKQREFLELKAKLDAAK